MKKHREQTYGHGWGEERVGCMETVTWKHVTICKLDNHNFLYDSGNSNRGSVINLEEWDVGGDGREVQVAGNIYTLMADSC